MGTKHLYLFLPSCKGAPPRCPDHSFLLGGEVLGREKGAEHGPLWLATAQLPCVHVCPPTKPATCSPGHWSSLTQMSFLSSPPQKGTHWLDPGHWKPFEFVLRLTSRRQAAQTDQPSESLCVLLSCLLPGHLHPGEELRFWNLWEEAGTVFRI